MAPRNSSFFDEEANPAAVLRLSTKELSHTGNASKHSRTHITQRPNFLCADTLFKETFCLYISRITYRRIVKQLLVGNIIVSLTDLFNIKHNNSNRAKSMENTSCVAWKSSRNYGKIGGNSPIITPPIMRSAWCVSGVRGFGVVEGKAFIPRVPPSIMDVTTM